MVGYTTNKKVVIDNAEHNLSILGIGSNGLCYDFHPRVGFCTSNSRNAVLGSFTAILQATKTSNKCCKPTLSGKVIQGPVRTDNKDSKMAKKERTVFSFEWAKALDVAKASKAELEKAFRIVSMRLDDMDEDLADLNDSLEKAKGKDKEPIKDSIANLTKAIEALKPVRKALKKAFKDRPDRGGKTSIHERGKALDKTAFEAMFAKPTDGVRSMLYVDGVWYAMPDKTTDTDDKGNKTEVTLHHYYHNDKSAKKAANE